MTVPWRTGDRGAGPTKLLRQNRLIVITVLIFRSIDPSLDEPGKIAIVPALNLWLLPVHPRNNFTAALGATLAFHYFVGVIFIHRIIKSQFFIDGDVS